MTDTSVRVVAVHKNAARTRQTIDAVSIDHAMQLIEELRGAWTHIAEWHIEVATCRPVPALPDEHPQEENR